MKLRQKSAKMQEAAETLAALAGFEQFKTQSLGVTSRGYLGIDGNNRLKLAAGDFVSGIVCPVAAVFQQKRIERRASSRLSR